VHIQVFGGTLVAKITLDFAEPADQVGGRGQE
jgi:hypothetical protein